MSDDNELEVDFVDGADVWLQTWLDAVELQAQRITNAPELLSIQPDAVMFVVAVAGAAQMATLKLGKGHHEVARFHQTVPDTKNLRDVIDHFDAYVRGQGFLQGTLVQTDAAYLGRLRETGQVVLHVFGLEMHVQPALLAVRRLVAACAND